MVADINIEGAQKVADGIKGEGGTALALPVDVSDPVSAKAMADQTLADSAASTTWSTTPRSSAG